MASYYLGFQKPPPGACIEWTHPLARGLLACYIAQPGNILMRDLARGRANDLANNNGVALVNAVNPQQWAATTPAPLTFGVGRPINPSAQFVAASAQSLSGADTPDLRTGNIDWTLYFWLNPTSLVSGQMLISKVGTLNANREFQVYGTSVSNSVISVDWWTNATGTSVNVQTGTGFLVANQWLAVFVWHNAGANTINIQCNNPQLAFNVGTIFSSAATGGNAGAAALYVGGRELAGNPTWNGFIDNVQIRKRVMTQDERTLLARNPYCFFRTPVWRNYSLSTPVLRKLRSFPIIMG